ncbi:MAG: mobile mystery protein B [Rhodanobacteraceae bacterium]
MSVLVADHDDGQTPLDADEINGLRMNWVTTRGALNDVEHENIQKGMTWASRAARRRKVLSDDFLRELHRQMFGDVWAWAGHYRFSEKNIGVAPHRIAESVRNLVEDVNVWMTHDVYRADERVARFHHRLVAVHPFPNGNGRLSRVAADLLMREIGKQPVTWGAGLGPVVSRVRYIEALRAADAGTVGPLIEFIRS